MAPAQRERLMSARQEANRILAEHYECDASEGVELRDAIEAALLSAREAGRVEGREEALDAVAAYGLNLPDKPEDDATKDDPAIDRVITLMASGARLGIESAVTSVRALKKEPAHDLD